MTIVNLVIVREISQYCNVSTKNFLDFLVNQEEGEGLDGRYTETILPTEHMEILHDRDTLEEEGMGEEGRRLQQRLTTSRMC